MFGLENDRHAISAVYSYDTSRVIIKNQYVCNICWIFLLVNMYLEIPLVLSTTTSIFAFPVISLIPLLFYVCNLRVRRSEFLIISTLYAVTTLSVVVANRFNNTSFYILKIIQFFVSIITGIITYKITIKVDRKFKRKFLLATIIVLVLGFMFETNNFLYIKDLSDLFREYVYSDSAYGVYNAENRDIAIAGFERPKFFTSEPSLAAIGYFIFSSGFLLVNKNYIYFWLVLLLDILCVVYTGSPVALLTFIAWIWVLNLKSYINWPVTLTIGSSVLIFLVIVLSPQFLIGGIVARLLEETINPDTSLYSRLYVPYVEALPTAIRYNFLFGVGYAGKDLLTAISNMVVFDNDYQFILGSNAFVRFFIFFGLLGMGIILFAFFRFLKSEGIKNYSTILVLWFLFGQMMGAMETPRYWMYLFFLIALAKDFNPTLKVKPIFVVS